MTVYVNLKKALISQVLVNGTFQRIEYEYLPSVCFTCDHYGHVKKICSKALKAQVSVEGEICKGKEDQVMGESSRNNNSQEGKFEPWMIIERKGRKAQGVTEKGEGR